jgi:predicted dehydrogenase
MRFPTVEVEDWAAATVELENGCVVEILSTMAATPERPPTIEVYGEAGTLLWRGGWGPARLRVLAGSPVSGGSPTGCSRRAASFRRAATGVHPLQRSLIAFRELVRVGTPHRCMAVESLPALLAVELAYRAAETGTAAEADAATLERIRLSAGAGDPLSNRGYTAS